MAPPASLALTQESLSKGAIAFSALPTAKPVPPKQFAQFVKLITTFYPMESAAFAQPMASSKLG